MYHGTVYGTKKAAKYIFFLFENECTFKLWMTYKNTNDMIGISKINLFSWLFDFFNYLLFNLLLQIVTEKYLKSFENFSRFDSASKDMLISGE